MKRALFLLPPLAGTLLLLAGIPLAEAIGASALGQCATARWFTKDARYSRVAIGLCLAGGGLLVCKYLPTDGDAVETVRRLAVNFMTIAFFGMAGLVTVFATLAAFADDETPPAEEPKAQRGS